MHLHELATQTLFELSNLLDKRVSKFWPKRDVTKLENHLSDLNSMILHNECDCRLCFLCSLELCIVLNRLTELKSKLVPIEHETSDGSDVECF